MMLALSRILSLLSLAPASLISRDFPAVQTNLATLDDDAENLTTATNNVVGGSGRSNVPLFVAQAKVSNDVNSTIKECTVSSSPTPAQSKSISRDITATFIPKLRAALNAIIAKKKAFLISGLSPTEAGFLAQLLDQTDKLASCLVSNALAVPSSWASATAAARSLSSLLASATSAYSSA